MAKSKVALIIFLFISVFSAILPWMVHPKKRIEVTSLTIGRTLFQVEVARTAEQITQGLSDRNAIGADGMLFVLPQRNIPSFWMFHMKFPLDFVWIDGDRVVDLTEHIPAPASGTPDSALPTYSPKVPVTHVLELPDGTIKKDSIQVGDVVRLNPQRHRGWQEFR
ncbi:MAG: DUF192 domain-containing protein [Patescibacteria group bacterium]